jgi:hypothetical protein
VDSATDLAQEMFDPLDTTLDRGDGCFAANLEYVVKCDSGCSIRWLRIPSILSDVHGRKGSGCVSAERVSCTMTSYAVQSIRELSQILPVFAIFSHNTCTTSIAHGAYSCNTVPVDIC